jgi:hypothetical protein
VVMMVMIIISMLVILLVIMLLVLLLALISLIVGLVDTTVYPMPSWAWAPFGMPMISMIIMAPTWASWW